jgi:S-adenosylmethionine:tRNA ribosyltransferase-isomerase
MHRTSDYDYALPESLIARWPLPDRAASRMMVLHRRERRIEHRSFQNFADFLREGDLVVLNDTKVIPARVLIDEGRIELLFLEQLSPNIWKCMVKPGRKLRVGKTFDLRGNPGMVHEILSPHGERIIHFRNHVNLEKVGVMPLPPYFERQAEAGDTERYQTVFAQNPGAIAAPTAGLHFTPEILQKIPHAFITLHVGVGTFKPVQAEAITDHRMHSERFAISRAAAEKINAAKTSAKRIVAVGTTTVRVLESCMARDGEIRAQENATDIFIHPPYEFRIVDALLTNFHLPKSTLLMLVSAFAGREFALEAYAAAIREQYRFYSYGDCMLIVD